MVILLCKKIAFIFLLVEVTNFQGRLQSSIVVICGNQFQFHDFFVLLMNFNSKGTKAAQPVKCCIIICLNIKISNAVESPKISINESNVLNFGILPSQYDETILSIQLLTAVTLV